MEATEFFPGQLWIQIPSGQDEGIAPKTTQSQLLATLRINVKDDCVVVAVEALLLLLVPPPPQLPNSNTSDSTKSRVKQQLSTFRHREPIHRNPNGMAASPNQVAR